MWERELDDLRKKSRVVKDTVRGSLSSFPYTTHSVKIEGVRPNKRIEKQEARLSARFERLADMLNEIDDFIDSLQDSQLRQIINYHYIKGYNWVKTARMIGGKNSVDAVKKRVYRFFSQNA